MKKLRHFIAMLVAVSFVGGIKPAAAFLPFIGAGTPTIDGSTDAGMGVTFVGTKLKTTVTTAIQTVQENLQTLSSKYNEYKNDFYGVMNSEEKAPLGGTRTILDSVFGKKDDPEAIRRAVYDLFLTYPSIDSQVQKKCEAKKNQFYIDTLIEINTAAIKLEQEYETKLKEKVENLPTDILTGENGAEVADSNNSAWKNKYNVYNTMNDLVQMLEELTAMKAQYMVAKGIMNEVPTKEPEIPEGQQSSLDLDEPIKLAGYAEHKEIMAFGQVETQASQSSTDETANTEGNSGGYTFRYQPDSNSSVSFSVSTEAGQESPYAGSREALADLAAIDPVYDKVITALKIHNLKQSLPSRRKNAEKYNDFIRLHEKAVERLKQSDACVIKFLNRYYQDGEKSWYGVYIGDQVTDYDLREGISGWALATYEAAKAELSNEDDSSSNLAEIELDPSVDSTNLSSVSSVESSVDSQNLQGGFKEKSKEEKAKENERKAELLSWQVGAEAVAQIASDQYSSSPQWGTVKKKFPIWQDQKSFYGQYIIGKYENIKSYLARVDLRRQAGQLAMLLNEEITSSAVSAAQAKAKAAKTAEERQAALDEEKKAKEIGSLVNSAIYQGLSAIPAGLEIPADISSGTAQEKAESKAALIKNRDEKLAQLATQRETIVSKLDSAMSAVSDLNADINRATIEGRAEEPTDEEYDVTKLMEERTAKEKEVETYEQQLADIDQMIEQINKAYITKEQEIDAQYGFNVVEENAVVEEFKNFEAPAISGANMIFAIAAETQKSGVISQANSVFAALRNYALEQVDKTKEEIFALGDNIYMPEGGEPVLSKHKDLIEKLKNINVNTISEAASVSQLSGASELISQAYSALMTEHICNDISCDEPDEEYFVGENGKEKDFAGPKAAPSTTAAPMREFVYFDHIDYENIPRLSDGSVAKDSVINYGHKVPEVWQYMLKNPAYVEKDINLEVALNKGGEVRNLLRGGTLPCYNQTKLIDAEEKEPTYYLSSKPAGDDYVACQGLEIASGGNGLLGMLTSTVINLELSKNNKENVKTKTFAGEETPSELGTFFTSKDNKLYYKEETQKAFERLKEIYESQNTGTEIEEKMSDDMYVKGQFKKNQIGDFLVFAEMEKDYRQQVEEMAQKIEEARQELITELTEVGFNPSEDFDIYDDKDYEEARNKLDKMKDDILSEVDSLMGKVKTNDTEVVKRRVATLKNNIAAMKKDSNELVNLSEATTADSSLDETIKSEEANQSVANKYQEEADNSMNDQINHYPIPYCAVY